MARVKFSREYNHEWPSGAVTRFRNNWEGSVKEEVAVAAVAAGAARRTRLAADPAAPAEPAATLPGNLDPALAEPQALTPNIGDQAPPDLTPTEAPAPGAESDVDEPAVTQ